MNWFTELAMTWNATTLGNKIWLVSWMAAVWILPIWMLLDSGVTPWKVFPGSPYPLSGNNLRNGKGRGLKFLE